MAKLLGASRPVRLGGLLQIATELRFSWLVIRYSSNCLLLQIATKNEVSQLVIRYSSKRGLLQIATKMRFARLSVIYLSKRSSTTICYKLQIATKMRFARLSVRYLSKRGSTTDCYKKCESMFWSSECHRRLLYFLIERPKRGTTGLGWALGSAFTLGVNA